MTETITFSETDFARLVEAAGIGDRDTARHLWSTASRMAELGDIEAGANTERLNDFQCADESIGAIERHEQSRLGPHHFARWKP